MYEIWSLGHKPFEDISGREVHRNTKLHPLKYYKNNLKNYEFKKGSRD